ncbi:lamin tail domain-containing protein [Gracilimonas sp.]|uniref:lamin tail domain-containing protein n=1 Tax=Gracilimonas sp. TaxID=1974203 RepID=UPI0032ECF4BF
MKKITTFLFSLLMLLSFSLGVQGQIISQYIETSSGTTPKGIEIWNNTSSTLDFSVDNLVIKKGTNGDPLEEDYTVSSGTLAPGDVMVIGTSDIETYLTNEGLTSILFEEKSFTFNGDDALSVEYGGVETDVFGDPGTGDPGSGWSGNGVQTYNQNIELNEGITTGSTGFTDPSTRFSQVAGGTDLTGFGIAPPSGDAATKLVITTINNGDSPTEVTGFSVTVQAQDSDDNPANVDSETDITLTLATGTGSLGDTVTGVMANGSNTVTISGVTYDEAESGVSITASDDASGLTSGTSSAFEVLAAPTKLVIKNFPSSGAVDAAISSFTVEVQREDNSVDENSSASVAISKASGSGALSATTPVTAVNGIATFSDVEFDAVDDYTVSVTSTGLTGATSGAISIENIVNPSNGSVFITEVSDAASDFNSEFIELYNTGPDPVDLTSSNLIRYSSDGVSSEYTFDIGSDGSGSAIIPGNGFLIITRGATEAEFETEWGTIISGVNYNEGNTNLFFGTGRRWVLEYNSTNIDSTTISVGDGTRHFQFPLGSQAFVEGERSEATPGELDGSIEISGNAGWRMLSLPIEDGTVADVSDDAAVQGITGGADTGDDANFYINTASDGTAQNGYTTPTNVTTPWGDGLGFIMYFFDNSSNGSSELPITLDASGTEPSGDVDVTLSDTWTLVGNPFASNFALDQLTGNDSGQGVNDGLISPASFWDDGVATDGSGSWITENFGSANGEVISTWQGFFIQRNSSSTTQLTFPEAGKTSDAATASYFSKEKPQEFREIELLLEAPNNQVDRSGKLYFSDQSAEGRDGFDGGKLTPLNGSPFISFVNDFGKGNELLVQDARSLNPETEQTYELVLSDAGVSGTYTLSWPEMTNIPDDWSFTLTDFETGNTKNMIPGSTYEFDVDAVQKVRATSVLNPAAVEASAEQATPRFGIALSTNTTTGNEPDATPESFALEQNYPNPFNPTTQIQYSVTEAGLVSLTIYNLMGQKVATLVGENKSAGTYRVNWNAANNASGIYYYRLQAGNQVLTRQMTLIK